MSMAASSRKRAAIADPTPSPTKKQRIQDDENYDADNHLAPSTVNSPTSSPASTERAVSVAETSITTASGSKRPKRYLCDYEGCGKAFDRPVRLQMHIRSHTNKRPFACTVEGCDKAFLRSEHLKAHIKGKHNDDREYVCNYRVPNADGSLREECGKAFHTGTRLRRHIAMHEEKEQTRCQECGKEFRKQETLQRHIKTVHLNEKAFRCSHVDIGPDADDQAEECGQTFSNAKQLRAHEARAHSGARYFCNICNPDGAFEDANADAMSTVSSQVGFSSYAELQTHTKLVHPPTCETCGQACESNRALKAHMDIEHASLTERQRFECTYPGCGRKFTKSGNMKVHVQTVHVKVKNFTCGQYDLSQSKKVAGWDGQGCGFGFGTKANLEEHIRTQHLNLPGTARPGKKNNGEDDDFKASSSRKSNGNAASMLTGIGYEEERPIACLDATCVQRFLRDYDLRNHMDLVHEWNIDDVNDQIIERDARATGKFWIGGGDEAEEEMDLRRRLVEGMQMDQQDVDGPMGNGLEEFLHPGMTDDMEVEGNVLDPALVAA